MSDIATEGNGIKEKIGYYRWTICALLFFATTINYVDRAVLGVLAPTLRAEIGWTDQQYGYISGAFTLAYAIGFIFAGWFIDRFGTRIGYSVYLTIWSFAAAAHALVRTAFGFGLARFGLGIGESGNFPAAIKTVAEWFPKKERALATGIFNAGSNVGAVIAPLVVPWIALNWGWQEAFLFTGLAGLIWVVFWWPTYRRPSEHPRLTKNELAYIESDPPDPVEKIPWLQLFPVRQTWAFAIGKFLTDAIWWFYLFWFPLFMFDRFGVDLRTIGLPMITVYLLADVGSVGGGWLSSFLLKRKWSVNAARKTAMLICAICILPVALAPHVEGEYNFFFFNLEGEWIAVFLIGIAAAAHQGFSANIFTLTSDMFPRKAVGSVVGIGGFAGAMGGFFMNLGAGWLKENTGSYIVMFAIAAVVYLLALLIIHLMAPKLEPVKEDKLFEKNGFNFGAACIAPIWLLFHGKIGLGLLLILYSIISREAVYLGIGGIVFSMLVSLIIMLCLGLVGNKIAMQHKKLNTMEETKESEREWNIAGIVVLVLIIALFIWGLLFYLQII